MKLIALALTAALLSMQALAQTQFPANNIWGNPAASQGLPRTVPVPTCTAGQALSYTGGTGFSCVAAGGGTGSPGGSNTQVQYNNSGVFAGAAAVTTNGSNLIINPPATAAFTPFVVTQEWTSSDPANILAGFTGYGDTGRFILRTGGGTIASPVSVAAGNGLGNIGFRGLDSSLVFSPFSDAFIIVRAAENFTPTAHGTVVDISTTPIGSTNVITATARFQASGGMTVGSINSGIDPGNAIFLANGLQSKVLTVATLPTCNAAAEGQRAYVSDQNTAVAYRGAVTGSGATRQAVLCSNSAWIQD